MRKNSKNVWLKRLAIGGLGLFIVSCGATEEEDTTTTSGSVYDENSTTTISSLSAIPDIGTLLVSSSNSLALQGSADAVVGTPPAFNDISADNIEEYLISDIDELVDNLVATAGSDWDQFDTYMDSFREGQNKCYVMQDAARQISELSSASTSSCYMKRVDAEEGTRLVTYVSGEEIEQGQFFAPSTDTVYRALQLSNHPEESMEDETIVFEIQGSSVESGVYQVTLNFCSSEGTLRNKEIIRVDNAEGELTVTNVSSGSEEWEGQSYSFAHNLVLTAGLLETTDGSIAFDPDTARTMEMQASSESSSHSDLFNGYIHVLDSKLTTKFINKGSSTWDGSTFEYQESAASIVRYTGDSMDDVAIYEGAGKRSGTFTDPDEDEPFTHSGSIIFEYNENESPKYATASSTDLSDELDLIDLTTDELLSQDEPAEPTTTLDDSVCSQTPSSVYSLDMAQEGMRSVAEACEAHFSEGDRICENIRQKEDQVWAMLHQSEEAE